MMTGRHDLAAGVVKRLVATPAIFGAFRDDGPAIEQESVHHLEKLVDGAPLRRPWWYFDVRVQGSGPVDIPTHLVDQAQWLADGDAIAPALLSARAWSTRVPAEAFRRITGEVEFPEALRPFVDGDGLHYRCNADLEYRIGPVTVHARTRWDLTPEPGGGDVTRLVARGTRADVRLEQSARTGHRRRVFVEPHAGAAGYEVSLPRTLDGVHETHFARVLDELLTMVDERHWPAALADRTRAKYTLLAEAAARTSRAQGRAQALPI